MWFGSLSACTELTCHRNTVYKMCTATHGNVYLAKYLISLLRTCSFSFLFFLFTFDLLWLSGIMTAVTDAKSETMPRLKYRVGDVAKISHHNTFLTMYNTYCHWGLVQKWRKKWNSCLKKKKDNQLLVTVTVEMIGQSKAGVLNLFWTVIPF